MSISKEDRDYVKSIHKSSTLYETLRVKPNSSPKEIRESFRFLSKKIHPDKNKAPGSTEAFKKLNNAYQTLINNESRHDYEKCNNNEPDSDNDDIIIIIVGVDGRSYCPGMSNSREDKREHRRSRRWAKNSLNVFCSTKSTIRLNVTCKFCPKNLFFLISVTCLGNENQVKDSMRNKNSIGIGNSLKLKRKSWKSKISESLLD